jgi:hypothetical protein
MRDALEVSGCTCDGKVFQGGHLCLGI